jgi:adenosylcobinamide-phosphate synthase
VSPRAVGLALGYALDALAGDPAAWHPVAGFGRVCRAVEERCYADSRRRGAACTTALVGTPVLAGAAAERAARRWPVVQVLTTAVATWLVLGGRSLSREAGMVHDHLAHGDLAAAREQVTHLVGRDPSVLDGDGVARATVESVAENTSDAVVAPLLWGAVAGPAGLLGYRAVNTLDAMVGHRSPRYLRFGWAAARLDDLVNVVPARVTALVAAAVSPLVGGPAAGGVVPALRAWWCDAGRHPSPNAGPVEAAFAGALGISLGGVNTYGSVVEDRGRLGSGPGARVQDIPRAVRLARLVDAVALTVAVTAASPPPTARRRRRR